MPSARSLGLGVGTVAVLCLQGLAVAQSPNAGAELGLGTRIGVRFGVSLVVYLVLGGALVALGPEYARSTVRELREDPGGAFGWGLVVGILGPIVLAVLAVTIIGLLVAIPGSVLLFVLGVVGNGVTVAWLGTVLAGDGSAVGGRAVGVGALALAVVGAVPVLGDLLTSLAGLFGLGAVSRKLYRSR